jgi:hypothetical protein
MWQEEKSAGLLYSNVLLCTRSTIIEKNSEKKINCGKFRVVRVNITGLPVWLMIARTLYGTVEMCQLT